MQVLGHITAETMERYRLRRLSAAEWLGAQTHAAHCDECRAKLMGAVDLDGSLAQVRAELTSKTPDFESEPEHTPYEQLAAYVDGTLDDVEREIADSHFAVCRDCASDLADLRRYQAIAATSTAAETAPSGLGTTAKTLWQRLTSFNLAPSFSRLLMPTAAAIILAVVLLGVWLASRTNRESNSSEIAKVNAPQESGNASPRASVSPTAVTNAGDATPITSTGNSSQATPQQNQSPAPEQTPGPTQPQRQLAPGGPTSTPPTIAFTLSDGQRQVTFDNRGNLRGLEELPASVQQTVRRSLEMQRIEKPRTLDSLAGAGGVLMSGAGSADGVPFTLVEPVGKIVRSDRPVLRWKPLAGAVSYTVAIVNANFRVVEQSQSLSNTHWTPLQPLPRGANYYWQVTATLPDGSEVTSPTAPAPQAKFRVLDASMFDSLKLLERANTDSHLAWGVLYAKAGLMDEAAAEFEQLVKANPRSSVARKLLESVRKAGTKGAR